MARKSAPTAWSANARDRPRLPPDGQRHRPRALRARRPRHPPARAVIGSDGYGYEFSNGRHVKIDQVGIVEIGDDVEIGANTTIDRARFGKTVIGEGTKIDNLVQIGHNCVIGKHCLIVSPCGISGSTRLGDYVTMAGQAGTAGHITIGDKATITGRAGVTTNLPGGVVYSGHPAKPFRDEMKVRAQVRRLPKLIERVKALEEALQAKTASVD
jgi:UDP-3-O-[3-hydroxymyristoyl] glucosamine N-acyltransferase